SDSRASGSRGGGSRGSGDSSGSGPSGPRSDVAALGAIVSQLMQEEEPTELSAEDELVERAPDEGTLLPMQQSLALVARVAEAIQFVHEHGVFHRDIKPANIMIREDGEPVVMDFGLAKVEAAGPEGPMSVSQQILGTIDYMAPEQAAASGSVDERADVYSIGAITYRMLTGQRHFIPSGNLLHDAQRLQDHEPTVPSRLNPAIEPELDAVVLKALRANPADRYATVRQFGEDIRRYQAGEPVSARQTTWLYRTWKRLRRRRLAVSLVMVILLELAVFAAIMVMQAQPAPAHTTMFDVDYPQGRPGAARFVADPAAQHPVRWEASTDGLRARPGDWGWLGGVRVPGDLRVTIYAELEPTGGLEVWTHGTEGQTVDPATTADATEGPVIAGPTGGNRFRFGGLAGRVHEIRRADAGQRAVTVAARPASIVPRKRTVRLTVERRSDRLTMWVDGEPVLSEATSLPLRKGDRVGLMAIGQPAYLKVVRVERLLAERESVPVSVAEALYRAGAVEAAVDAWMDAADQAPDHLGAPLRARAATAALLSLPAGSDKLVDVRKMMSGRDLPPGPAIWLAEAEARRTWRIQGEEALVPHLERLARMPGGRAAIARLLERREREIYGTGVLWLETLNRSEGPVYRLNLSGLGLEAIGPLRRLPLASLDLSDNPVDSLEPLMGRMLVELDLENTDVVDLWPLDGMPLRRLNILGTSVRDLTPLHRVPLKELVVSPAQINRGLTELITRDDLVIRSRAQSDEEDPLSRP
ncbi:MAG: serine/threonine-protein kinase, partial [Phycisphaeraceae bacterium]|nr:serine/threonine-protein kinase [Phycisphaeraceae bacterium]